MTTNRYGIRLEHLGPDAEESDVARYVEYLKQAGIEPDNKEAQEQAWSVFCAAGSFEAAAAELARTRGEVTEAADEDAKPRRTTYTVRPRGCTAWVRGLPSLAAARAEAREARARGLRCVIITEDASGREVE